MRSCSLAVLKRKQDYILNINPLIPNPETPSLHTDHLPPPPLPPARKKSIGYLPQDLFFIDGTIRENLVWDSKGPVTDEEIWKVLEQVNAAHLAKRYRKGLDAYIVNY